MVAQPTPPGDYGAGTLPSGIRARLVSGVNGITMHVLEAGFESPGRRGLLLVHGFPELGYSWRKVMVPLAAAGYHVMAPDQRGYGRSGGTDVTYDADLAPFSTFNRVRDMLALTSALGHRSLAGVVGHDFGSPVAAWCALARPDVFQSVVMMSAPFAGTARLPFNTANQSPAPQADAPDMDAGLAALTPARKHYQTYYTTREANGNMWHPPQGLQAFLRAYYHAKSADWPGNAPHPLAANTPAEFAKLPRYYVMDKDKGMAEQMAAEMPLSGADCRLPLAPRSRACRVRRGVLAHWIPGRSAVVPRRARAPALRGIVAVRRPHHRRARSVHLRQERLGRVPARRQLRGHADDGMHEVPRRTPSRRRGALGAAGTAGEGR